MGKLVLIFCLLSPTASCFPATQFLLNIRPAICAMTSLQLSLTLQRSATMTSARSLECPHLPTTIFYPQRIPAPLFRVRVSQLCPNLLGHWSLFVSGAHYSETCSSGKSPVNLENENEREHREHRRTNGFAADNVTTWPFFAKEYFATLSTFLLNQNKNFPIRKLCRRSECFSALSFSVGLRRGEERGGWGPSQESRGRCDFKAPTSNF